LEYLKNLGFEVYVPEVPCYKSDYVPYAFSDCEIGRLFGAADGISSDRRDGKKSAAQFSVYLRHTVRLRPSRGRGYKTS
jgi:hypothetical protein